MNSIGVIVSLERRVLKSVMKMKSTNCFVRLLLICMIPFRIGIIMTLALRFPIWKRP